MNGHIRLSKMDPACIDSKGNVDAIVDDQRHVVSVANGLRLQGYLEELEGL